MRTFYPLIKPNRAFNLSVSEGHSLYVEECGNDAGLPVLFVHGGPGGGCRETDRCFFDPEKYRIILFDQRGCGRSTPHGSLLANTTDHLIGDIEAIRRHLAIERWLVFGGSWGSTLALLYAQAHAERVLGLVLRGIFLCRQRDIDWFYQSGASYLFPEYWCDFVRQIPAAERDNMVQAYYRQLISDNELERMAAAKAWSLWEGRCSTLLPNAAVAGHFGNPHFALALARIEAHYFINHCFVKANAILDNASRLAGIPGTIVHGRYDVVCPVEQAVALAQAWPGSELHIIQEAGHASSEPPITDALVKATDAMAVRFGNQK
jgi:proline iminopeptidase